MRRDAVQLARILPLYEYELREGIEDRTALLDTLVKALAAEKRRGLAGHWTYDKGRHSALIRLYRSEVMSVGQLAAAMLANMTDRPEWADRVKDHELRLSEHMVDPSELANRFFAKMVEREKAGQH